MSLQNQSNEVTILSGTEVMPKRRELANAIRALSMDAVQQANSGHPGMPLGMADIAEVLWRDFLKHNPQNPNWIDRDRFVLSNGHGSMLLYSCLHLSGYDLPMDELKNFRQLHSKAPAHPELGYTPGVETTTGPLGQGIANAVGMAIAEKNLAATYNRDGHEVVDHYTYAFMGDGCLMEGISHEVCSLAGTLGLGKLIALWDDNGISIDGEVDGWFTDITVERFKAYGWHVIADIDGHDAVALHSAIAAAREERQKPTLICCKTTIGFGAPNAGSEATHGAPLGKDKVAATREALGWHYAPFEIPEKYYSAWDGKAKGQKVEQAWNAKWQAYEAAYPELAVELQRRLQGDLPSDWQNAVEAALVEASRNGKDMATRKASQAALNVVGPVLPELFGGSADLTCSVNTNWSGSKVLSHDDMRGNYLSYGVREFGMYAIMNGLALHGGFIPYGGTFLVFSDYARNALRMAALMKQRSIMVFTHDSIGLGEDGPTHQPVEHVAGLRIMPNMHVWRPCDDVESLVAWQMAVERHNGPSALILSRQNLAHQARDDETTKEIRKGGYVLSADANPQVVLVSTGSEVQLAMSSAEKLREQGVAVQVVSMPCVELFLQQTRVHRDRVLPRNVPVVAIEAGVSDTWHRFVGPHGKIIGLDTFGESAPAGVLYKHFGFTVENIVAEAKELL